LKNGSNFNLLSDYIIFENDEIIVINKPEGLLSVPDGYDQTKTNLRDILKDIFGEIWVVHRLDKSTSGVIIFAKNPRMHKILNTQFSQRNVTKKYIAYIHGSPIWDTTCIEYPLRINGDRHHRTVIDLNTGKIAKTYVEIIERRGSFCLAHIYPKTGLTHQIRSHCSNIGHPIIGDYLYDYQRTKNDQGKISTPFCKNGLFLHAADLRFLEETLNFPQFSARTPEKFYCLSI